MAIALKGDFIGFSYDGIRSEDLGLVRVSSSNRYSEQLSPTTQDSTVQVPGSDGFYYFGSYHTQKQFSIAVAFDSLSENDFRRLGQVFTTKGLHKLIFDERPYKYYMVKANTPELKYICFDQDGERVYKGEGTFKFTSYYPYAKSVWKYSSDYSLEDYPNKNEWLGTSGLIEEKLSLDSQIKSGTIYETSVYNAGDLEADFTLTLLFSSDDAAHSFKTISLLYESEASPRATLILGDKIQKKGKDIGLRVNTKTNLVEGIVEQNGVYVASGNLYNEYIEGGEFFKIPTMEIGTDLIITNNSNGTKTYTPKWKITYSADTDNSASIEYDYIYY